MHIHIEVFAFQHSTVHGAIWTHTGVAIPISMPMESYETALANGLFKRIGEQEDLFPDANGVLNESPIFSLVPNPVQ